MGQDSGPLISWVQSHLINHPTKSSAFSRTFIFSSLSPNPQKSLTCHCTCLEGDWMPFDCKLRWEAVCIFQIWEGGAGENELAQHFPRLPGRPASQHWRNGEQIKSQLLGRLWWIWVLNVPGWQLHQLYKRRRRKPRLRGRRCLKPTNVCPNHYQISFIFVSAYMGNRLLYRY